MMRSRNLLWRDSLRNIRRSGTRSLVFFILLSFAASLLILSAYAQGRLLEQLDRLDQSYKTIAVMEYRGPDYPNEEAASPGILQARADLDIESIKEHPAVKAWEPSCEWLAFRDDFLRSDNIQDIHEVVLRIKPQYLVSEEEEGFRQLDLYACTVKEALFATSNLDGKQANVLFPAGTPIDTKTEYLVSGRVLEGRNPIKTIQVEALPNPLLEKDEPIGGVVAVKNDEELSLNDDEASFHELAQALQIRTHHIVLEPTDDLGSVYLFHQGLSKMSEGRRFSDEEIASGESVCIVSEFLAKQLELKLGDSLDFQVLQRDIPEKWNPKAIFSEALSYRIVGIRTGDKETNHIIHLPASSHNRFKEPDESYRFGTFILENDQAVTFQGESRSFLSDRVQIDVYDQGYAAVAEPYRNILALSKLVLGICAVVACAIVLFFAYHYVYRQEVNARTMIRLGVPKRKVIAYSVISSGIILFFANVVALIFGYLLSDRLDRWLLQLVETEKIDDLRYSSTGLVAAKESAIVLEAPWRTLLIPAIVYVLVALLILLIFAWRSLQGSRRGGISLRSKARMNSSMSRSKLKWLGLSLRRNGLRNALSILAIAFSLFFLIYLVRFPKELDQAIVKTKEESTVKGYFTDIYGKRTRALLIEEPEVSRLADSGFIHDLKFSGSMPYRYAGLVRSGDKEQELPYLKIPQSSFARESFFNELRQGEAAVYSNDFYSAPEFYYSRKSRLEPETANTVLSEKIEEQPYPVIVTRNLLEREGLKMGDVVRFILLGDGVIEFDFKIVGVFQKAARRESIYMPVGIPGEVKAIYEGIYPDWNAPPVTYQSAEFLVPAKDLDVFKEYLAEEGFSSSNFINKNRQFIVLEDQQYLETMRSLRRQQEQVSLLYPILRVLVFALALLLPMLLMYTKRREMAIMLSVGRQKIAIFWQFMAEQVILLLVGWVLGLGAAYIWSALETAEWMAALIFVLLWIVGVAIQLIYRLRQPALKLLHEAE